MKMNLVKKSFSSRINALKKSTPSLINSEITEYTTKRAKFFFNTFHAVLMVSATEKVWYIGGYDLFKITRFQKSCINPIP
jgi:hypothetical protein